MNATPSVAQIRSITDLQGLIYDRAFNGQQLILYATSPSQFDAYCRMLEDCDRPITCRVKRGNVEEILPPTDEPGEDEFYFDAMTDREVESALRKMAKGNISIAIASEYPENLRDRLMQLDRPCIIEIYGTSGLAIVMGPTPLKSE